MVPQDAQDDSRRLATNGPLRVYAGNPRYFADASGKTVYLTGSHTWATVQDLGLTDPPSPFDFNRFLDFMEARNHNFLRMWTWEGNKWQSWTLEDFFVTPFVYARTGPGEALDGKPKFDLRRFSEDYFERLRTRVRAARDRGIYVSVMLFQGWSIELKPWRQQTPRNPWPGHPFHASNNINGINGDPNEESHGLLTHTLKLPEITEIQKTYIRRVIDTVNEFDNVLYEITNEDRHWAEGIEWQYAMIDYIHAYEATGNRKQHPTLLTVTFPGATNDFLYESRAEAISPSATKWYGTGAEDYRSDPPAADGRKVILADHDHFGGTGGDVPWVWKSFTRGLNVLYMDPYGYVNMNNTPPSEAVRVAMGHALRYARRVDLEAMTPHCDLTSTGYCLAAVGNEYLVYQPGDGDLSVDLRGTAGPFSAEWCEPETGTISKGATVAGGEIVRFHPPLGNGAVLYLTRPR
jgi:hypothetical protein